MSAKCHERTSAARRCRPARSRSAGRPISHGACGHHLRSDCLREGPRSRCATSRGNNDGKDHLLPGKCDPRKCPLEINREKRGTPALKRSLCRHVGEKDRPLVTQFRASPRQFGEGRERAQKPCWQSEANPSLPAIWGIAGRFGQVAGTSLHIPTEDPLHLSGLDGFLPNSTSRETKFLAGREN